MPKKMNLTPETVTVLYEVIVHLNAELANWGLQIEGGEIRPIPPQPEPPPSLIRERWYLTRK